MRRSTTGSGGKPAAPKKRTDAPPAEKRRPPEQPTLEGEIARLTKEAEKRHVSPLVYLLPLLIVLILSAVLFLVSPDTFAPETTTPVTTESVTRSYTLASVPEFSGEPYVVINGNEPDFAAADKRRGGTFESYAPLDDLGRCDTAFALLGRDTMPEGERGSIGSVKPSGWHLKKYKNVEGGYLYNRCHLIGYQLSGENANRCNLITGTRYLNTQGMLPFENEVADYIRTTGNRVLYRVTPIFGGDELVARGVQIEAYSVEDGGAGVRFNVYCYNVQPGVIINYETGTSKLAG